MKKSEKHFDVIIIGGGVAGIVAALTAKKNNLNVALIEASKVGGATLHSGRLLLDEVSQIGKKFSSLKDLKEIGIEGIKAKDLSLNWSKIKTVLKSKDSEWKKYFSNLLKDDGVTLFKGRAKVIDENLVEVNNQTLACENLILALGSRYSLPDFVSKNNKYFYTPENFLTLEKLPQRAIILGAGLIGLEFSFALKNLGLEVEIVEQEDSFMKYLDKDLKKVLLENLEKEGIVLHLGYKAIDLKEKDLLIENDHGKMKIKNDFYLSALGRSPSFLGIENLLDKGLSYDKYGIDTDLRCRTSLNHVFAIGDLNGRVKLANVAASEAQTVVETIVDLGEDMDYELTHYNMYTKPELASIGMSEEAALEAGFLVSVGKFIIDKKKNYFIKAVSDKTTGEILGVHICSDNASALISEASLIIENRESVMDLARLVHEAPVYHETMVEILKTR